MEWLNFVEKVYFTIVDLFCRYKSDSNKNIAFINGLQQCPQSLIGKKDIALRLNSTSLYVPVIQSGVASPRSQHR